MKFIDKKKVELILSCQSSSFYKKFNSLTNFSAYWEKSMSFKTRHGLLGVSYGILRFVCYFMLKHIIVYYLEVNSLSVTFLTSCFTSFISTQIISFNYSYLATIILSIINHLFAHS